MHSKKINILQIGPITEIGAVSVHIHRLCDLMSNYSHFKFIDECKKNINHPSIRSVRVLKNYIYFIKYIYQSDIVHIHLGNWVLRIVFILLSIFFNRKIVLTLHGQNTLEDLNPFSKKLTLLFLNKVFKIICVNQKIKNDLPINLIPKISVCEAFLPPNLSNEEDLPVDLIKIINKHKKKSLLICANAYKLVKVNGMQLYGLDQCIEFVIKAKKNKINIHLFYIISYVPLEDKKTYNIFLELIKKHDLSTHITLVAKPISFIKLIKLSDIVLRPTLTDGDALTVREALYFNKTVIASNVVDRPKGVILYNVNDDMSLYKTISNLASKNLESKSGGVFKDYYKFYFNIYNACVE